MQIYPAIDLKDGQGVRLKYGDFDQMTVYAPDPAATAAEFVAIGCSWIHVVDLDGALQGKSANNEAVAEIVKTGAKIQLGGGLRSLQAIEDWLSGGVERVILGTAALKDPELVREAARGFPGRIAVGADARGGMIAAEGWLEESTVPVLELARRFEDCGVAALIFTDISRDGALTGVNAEASAALAEQLDIPVIASGGVASLADIEACAALAQKGLDGVITGRAIYDGRLDLARALQVAGQVAGQETGQKTGVCVMLCARVIPCLDVHAGRVVKGVNFVDLVDAGDPVEQARLYDAAGADELCFLDITASHEGRESIYDVIARTAEQCFMPLTVGGGVRAVEDFRRMLLVGADKVSVNSAAVADPDLLARAAIGLAANVWCWR